MDIREAPGFFRKVKTCDYSRDMGFSVAVYIRSSRCPCSDGI